MRFYFPILEKRWAFIKIFEKGNASHLPENIQTRYVILLLNLVPHLIVSKIRLRNFTGTTLCYMTRTRLCRRLHWYTGETGKRLNERVIETKRDNKKTHLHKRSLESNHPCVALSNFKIIGSNFLNQKFKKKLLSCSWLERRDHHLTRQRWQFH